MPRKKSRAYHYGDSLPKGAVRRFGTTRFWHLPFEGGNPGTNDMAFSSDGRQLAALGYQDDELSVFNVPSGKSIRRWHEGHVDGGGKLLFSPKGNLLAVACDDGLRLRNPKTGRLVREFLRDSCAVNGIAFSPDGKLLASAKPVDGRIEVWRVSTGKLLYRFEADRHPVLGDDRCELLSDEFYCVAFSPDGQLVAAGSRHFIYHHARGPKADKLKREVFEKYKKCHVSGSKTGGEYIREPKGGRILCWELKSGALVAALEGHNWPVYFVGFTRDGLLRSFAGEMWTWDVRSARRVGTSGPPSTFIKGTAIFSQDGCHAARAGTGFLALTNLISGEEINFKVNPDWREFNSLVASPDARWLATEMQGCIHLWDSKTAMDVAPAERHTTWVYALHFSGDGTKLISSSTNEAIVWGLPAGRMVCRFPQYGDASLQPRSLAYSSDGKHAACAGSTWEQNEKRDGLLVWDCQSGSLVDAWDEQDVTASAWTANGEALIFGTKTGDIFIRRLAKGRRVRLGEVGAEVSQLAVSPDGCNVAAIAGAPQIHWWDLSRRRRRWVTRVAPHPGASEDYVRLHKLRFSPDNRQIAFMADNGHIFVGQLDQSQLSHSVTVPRKPRSVSEYTISFHPNGNLLSAIGSGTDENEGNGPDAVWAWEMKKVRALLASPPLDQPISALAFSPDGRILASGSWDSTILLWRLASRGAPPHKGRAAEKLHP